MDMNRFHLIPSVAFVITGMLKSIRIDDLRIFVDELAIEEPFKTENEKIYVPPFDYVNEVLQKKSALIGINDKEVRKYCHNFLKFVKLIADPNSKKLLKPLERMMSKKETFSDKIISEAKKLGANKSIDNKQATELSLKLTEKIWKDIDLFETFI
jgi:hypothetical protein